MITVERSITNPCFTLVSNAFEKRYRIPLFRPDGESILGMEKFVNKDNELSKLFKDGKADLVLSPNAEPEGSVSHSTSTAHGDFDDNIPTVKATLARILNISTSEGDFKFTSSASSLKDRRSQLSRFTQTSN
jgi:hypothetical protein